MNDRLRELLSEHGLDRAAQDEVLTLVAARENAGSRAPDPVHALMELVPLPFVELGVDGKLLFANAAIRELRVLEKGQGSFADVIAPVDRERATRNFRSRVAGGRHERDGVEYQLVRTDGVVFPALVYTSTFERKGELRMYSVVADLSQRRDAEEQRRRLEAQVQHAQKLDSLGVLAGGIAHDFNNLLASILGNAELGLLDLPAEGPRQYLQAVVDAAERAADLTAQMLAYAGEGSVRGELVDLSSLIDDLSALLRLSVPKGADLNISVDGTPPLVKGDAAKLRQVIVNLVTNAGEAVGPKRGRVDISLAGLEVGDAEEDDLPVEELAPGTYARLQVSDNGIGMDDVTLSRIFEPFFSTRFPGRGLGLAAVLGIVNSHGGVVEVQSSPGDGATFTVWLPAGDVERAEIAPVESSGLVLVVEDEDPVRRVACVALRRAGFEVLEARDGDEAVEVFARRHTELCLVLLDLTMRRMDGDEALLRIQALDSAVPVLIVSGRTPADLHQRFAEARPAGFLRKPYTIRGLIEWSRAHARSLPTPGPGARRR